MTGKMAAVESKHNNVSCEDISKNVRNEDSAQQEIPCQRYGRLDLLLCTFSACVYLADIITDIVLSMNYLLEGYQLYGYFTLGLVLLPTLAVQLISLRWHYNDSSLKNINWISHIIFLGILHRYLTFLWTAVCSIIKKQPRIHENWFQRQESDICMLHLFEAFMRASPQLVMQLYVITILHGAPPWTNAVILTSSCSFVLAVLMHTKVALKKNVENEGTPWIAIILQALWHVGMLTARVIVLALLTTCIGYWFLLFLGVHWICMTIWVILQKTEFCSTAWEERVYNCIMGLIYCFDFFNLRGGKSRYRVLIFYTIIIVENLIFLIMFLLYYKNLSVELSIISITAVISSMIIGLGSMLFYYCKFHPSLGKRHRQTLSKDPENELVDTNSMTPRSLKRFHGSSVVQHEAKTLNQTSSSSPVGSELTTDKQYLLTNIVQSLESVDEMSNVKRQCNEIQSEAETRRDCESYDTSPSKLKDISIVNKLNQPASDSTNAIGYQTFSPDLDSQEITMRETSVCFASQRRRGICSLAQLIAEIEEEASKDIEDVKDKIILLENERNEEVDNTKANELNKDFQQRDDAMSQVTSIHDYENVCPLGVARPPWCIRSWKAYTDIETYLHDDSVVRDRRRDTLTSTTGTTISSDYSDATCVTCSMKGTRSKHDDYMDTLTYDLVEPRSFGVLSDDINFDETASNLLRARPIFIDDRDNMMSLDTIIEEREDSIAAVESKLKSISSYNSFSTLVSTIDQIRQFTAENSPRHVYHRTESLWDDADPKMILKRAQLAKVFFSHDMNNQTHSIENSPSFLRQRCEVDTMRELVRCRSIRSIKKTPLIDAILSDSPILGNRTKLLKDDLILGNEEPATNEDDLYVDMRPLVNTEKIENSNNVIADPRLSLPDEICKNAGLVESKSNITIAKTKSFISISHPVVSPINILPDKRKKMLNYPRRKFSLLKERFEPKSRLVYVVSPNKLIEENQQGNDNILSVATSNKFNSKSIYDKENLAPVVLQDDVQECNYENVESSVMIYENDKAFRRIPFNEKESRHIFLEQALSPSRLIN